MPIAKADADRILSDCGRHCCICRRFRPSHLQVHHIVERADGGSDDPDNLIAVCVSCHCDVHGGSAMTRRFTDGELMLHRQNVVRLVADGKLRSPDEADDRFAALSALLVGAVAAMPGPARPEPRPLSAEAVDILLGAVRGNTRVQLARYDGGSVVLAGGRTFGETYNLRLAAKYRKAVAELAANELVEEDGEELFAVTDDGYVLADDLVSAAGLTMKNA